MEDDTWDDNKLGPYSPSVDEEADASDGNDCGNSRNENLATDEEAGGVSSRRKHDKKRIFCVSVTLLLLAAVILAVVLGVTLSGTKNESVGSNAGSSSSINGSGGVGSGAGGGGNDKVGNPKEEQQQQAIDKYINRFDLTDEEVQFLNMMEEVLQTEYAGDSSRIDVGEIEFSPPGYSVETHYMSVPGMGFGNVASEYASQFESKIQLNSRVTDIDYRNDESVSLAYVQGWATRRVEARTVLVTASLGVLKSGSIHFDPALPSWKQESIDAMGFGLVNKCILTWKDDEDRVWPRDKLWFILVTPEDETSGLWTTFYNPTKFKGVPTLTAWIGGDEAIAAERQSDDEILNDVMKNLRAMFPSIRDPDNVLVLRWGADENVRGTYSFPVPGRDFYDDAANLQEPVGRVWFAGEATGTGWATTMGAWNTGEDAASDMARVLEEA